MLTKKNLLTLGVVLLGFVLWIPIAQFADAQGDLAAKISPALQQQLADASHDEIVTAIVRVHEVGPPARAQGTRAGVFSQLRQNAQVSQMELVNHLNQDGRVKLIRQFWIDNIVLVQAPKDVINRLAGRRDVIEIFENFTITVPRPGNPQMAPMAPSWDPLGVIGVRSVWSTYGMTGTGVRVGGLDTGVDISHPDIAGKMITNTPGDPTYPGGWAEFDGNGNLIPGSIPHDSAQHGTHTSGTMIGGNASGYDIGVAPGAGLMHGLVIPGGSGSFAQVAGGMEWIIDPDGNPLTDDGAQVVNMSLGATGTHPAMIAPTDNMVAAGVFPSFSIGNSGPSSNTTGSPGNVPSAYGVGATASNDVIASFSSRGPVTWNDPPYVGTWTKPDISAPGVNIYSAVPGGGWEGDWSGTSMAAPHISGVVALMLQANPSLTVATTKQLLAQTALDLGTPGMDNDYGWGRVSAFDAVSAALVGVGTLEGTVYSSAGGTVDNAQILVVDTGQRVHSDATGHYSIQLVAGDHTIEVSRFGYDSYTQVVTIIADATTTVDVTLNQLPSGTVAGTVTDQVSGMGIASAINVYLGGNLVVTSSTNPATGEYSVVLPIGTYDLSFVPTFPYPVTTRNNIEVFEAMTTTVDVALMPAQVLLVDDDGGDGYESYFEQAIVGAGRSYLRVTTPPTAAEMALFSAVVWFTGNDYTTTLTAADQAALAAYLDGGGRLFLTGQDIGYDIRTDAFYTNYLHAGYVQDDVNLGGVYGNMANPVGVGFSFEIKGGTGASNQSYPSEIDALAPAMPAFFYDPAVPSAAATTNGAVKQDDVGSDGITGSGGAGLTYDDGVHRLVYLSFGFEAIATATDRTAVMARVLDWLQGYPEITHTPLGDTENTSDPYHVTALITSDYFPLDPSTFAVVYNTGGPDFTLPMTATGNPDEYEAYIPAQPIDTDVAYYITAGDVEGHTTTDPLGAPANRHHFSVAKDQVPPTVEHSPYRDTNDLTGPYMITAMVTDNIGVESVYLLYAKNGGMYHRVKMMLVGENMYAGAIPGPSMVGDYYDYHLYAMDDSYSGNITRVPATGDYRFNIVEEFVWDFELDDGGFLVDGNVWEWGEPTSGPGGAHSGVKLWATNLTGDYPNSANAKLDIPEITLAADRPYAVLSMWQWYYIETNYDGGNVKISTDGGASWSVLTPDIGYNGTARTSNAGIPGEPCFTGYNNNYWHKATFDLSPYTGQQVNIRFHFGSDGSVFRPGWYVDDVRLRSTSVDDVAPTISNTVVPPSTFDTAGPYTVTTQVTDLFSGVASVSLLYSTDDGASYSTVPMAPGGGANEWTADIPGQSNGARIQFYIEATDNASNTTVDPPMAPAATHAFAILPSAPIMVVVASSAGISIDDFRAALEAHGHAADYWYQPTQGALTAEQLQLYKMVILDERGSLTASEQANLAAFLESGTPESKKRFWILGRDLGYYSSTRPWIAQYMRGDYVQDNPGWRELTGESGDPIGIGETFVISGSYPDEIQRSATYPGAEIVYRYSAPGTAAETREELQGTYDKDLKEWDGVMPHAPISLDAAAGLRYNGDQYRSVYFSFNFDYIQEPGRRADIADRVIRWAGAPDIAHTPLPDTENTTIPYVVVAQSFGSELDPTRVKLTYDVGAGAVVVNMAPTGNPDEFSASIPAQPLGTTVNYYLSAANYDGTTAYHPAGAPAVQHSFVVNADNVPPVIVHAPTQYSADLAGPYTIAATITDNVGVDPATARVVYNKNGGPNTSLPMSSLGGDEYAASIPGPSVVGDAYNYYIVAQDIAAVPNTGRDPAVGFHTMEIVDFFAWDFETDDGGFAATGDWEWGAPTAGPDAAHSGVNVWGTVLGGNYSNSSNSRLETPAVIVPTGSTYATLSFWQWYYVETNYDGGNVKISTDGGASWSLLTPDIGYNGTARSGNAAIPGEPCFTGYNNDVWHQVSFDLTPYKGMSVMIRLHFGSDSSVQRVGWYVDDMRIEGLEDTAAPEFVSTSVPASTFDTTGPYTVSTVVQDGLSGVASVTLHYSTDDGATYTNAAMSPTGNPDEYSADIPGQSGGTRIKLYVSATDNASNGATDPAGAPGTTYEFGIMPSGDYLVLLGGASHTPATTYQAAFAAIGRTADVWDWDDLGMPTVAILQAYTAVIVDESWYLDTTQQDSLGVFLATPRPQRNQIFMMGRDLSYGSSARPWMEQHTGAAYVKDDPGFRELKSAPGDPIGNNETFLISGSYPDELQLSTTYPGGAVVFRYNALGTAYESFGDELNFRQFIEKSGKEWDARMWPMAPSGPDSAAAIRYVGTNHVSVYCSFQFNYIQDETVRNGLLDRALDWLASAATSMTAEAAPGQDMPTLPQEVSLDQNYPNPFNPVTRIRIGIPAGQDGNVALKVYNVRGQLVRTIFAGHKPAGFHTFEWDGTSNSGSPVASGIYFARFVAGERMLTRKMILLK